MARPLRTSSRVCALRDRRPFCDFSATRGFDSAAKSPTIPRVASCTFCSRESIGNYTLTRLKGNPKAHKLLAACSCSTLRSLQPAADRSGARGAHPQGDAGALVSSLVYSLNGVAGSRPEASSSDFKRGAPADHGLIS
jgi:hypothetical protein